jgi:drug/metabolite transporter (DMT)-like permease
VLSSFQQFGLAFSHKLVPASILAPLHYLSIPMGIGAGIMLFGEALTLEIIVGSAIIIASSIFILRRERQLREAGQR